jgi:gamma-glutamylcyclotransferase (GGCT)/AIG2-like uncharacterized protein YtfP
MTVPPSDPFLLFVYGTLMRDGVNHTLLAGQRFVGRARTRPRYALFNLNDFRGLVPCASDGTVVHGELYEVARALVPRLDQLEEAPTLFRLEPVEIEETAEPVYAYFYQQDTRGFSQSRDSRTDAQGDGP